MPFVGSHGAYYRFSRLALSRLPRFDLTGLRLCLELPPVEPPAERIGAFGAFVRVEGLDPCGPSAYSEFREAIAPILSSSPIAMILSKPDSAVATTSLAVSKAMRSDDVRRPLPATEREPPPRGAPEFRVPSPTFCAFRDVRRGSARAPGTSRSADLVRRGERTQETRPPCACTRPSR